MIWFRSLKESFSFLKGNFFVLVITWTFWALAMNMVGTYEPRYIEALGANPFILGAIYATSTVILCLVRIPGGFIADKFGRKKIIVTMSFAAALTYLPYAYAPSWEWVLTGSILGYMCMIYQPALYAMFADSVRPEWRGKGFALSNFLPAVAVVPAPLIAGYFVSTRGLVSGMRAAYSVAVGLGFFAAFLRIFLKETLPKKKAELKTEHSEERLRGFRRGYSDALKFVFKSTPTLLMFHLIFGFSYVCSPFFIIFAMGFLGMSEANWALILVAYNVTFLVATMPMGILTDRIGRRKVLILSISVFILSTSLWIKTPPLPNYAVLSVLISFSLRAFADAAVVSALPALEADLVPKVKRGRVIAILRVLSSITTAVGQVLMGLWYEQIAPHFPFIVVIIVMLIGFAIALLTKEYPRREI